jgi:hypothetical protein
MHRLCTCIGIRSWGWARFRSFTNLM